MTATQAGKADGPSADDYALVAKVAAEIEAPELPYRPPMPRDRGAPIALVGAGGISGAHLDAYARYGLNVVAICSRDLERARARRDAHFPNARVTDDFDSVLRDPDVRVLDLTAHPDMRLDLMRRALNADKHVLSQKPFVENLDDGRELVELAEYRGLKLAVNQNGRWAPHLAYIREAVRADLIGEVTGVHVEIRWNHGWIAGTSFETMDDLILWDFGVHWFDFLASVIGDRARFVHATAAQAAGQAARPPLLAQALVAFDGGQASFVFDGATHYGARDSTSVVGTKGVACSLGPDLGHQAVELYTEAGVARPQLTGSWFNDGFAGAMGELLCAIEDERQPLNSARGNLLSLKLCQAGAALGPDRLLRSSLSECETEKPTAGCRRSSVIELQAEKNAMAKGRADILVEPPRPLEFDPQRMRQPDRRPYAIIDIGSNSIRLLVYDQLGRAPMPRFNEKSLARLAEGLPETGAIGLDHFRRAIEAVRRFRAIAEAMGVSRIDAVATEAMRRASNGPELAAAIEAEAGLKVRVLSGAEEARFATFGVISGFFRPVGTVADMGGGSLEIAEAIDDRVGDSWVSMPLGALPVEAMLSEGVSPAKRQIDEILRRSLPRELARPVFYAVGGGWRALAKAHMDTVGAAVKVVHGYTLSAAEAREFAHAVSRLSAAKLTATPGVAERRARTLPAAALTLDRVLKYLKPERVVFSALGLREGFLYSQLSREEQYLDPLIEGAQLIGPPFARVPEFASELVSWTESLFLDEAAAEKRLRVAVCALSDIAWRDAADLRAEESFRRLLEFPFIGVTHPERVFIAAAIHARYVGRPDARWLSPAIKLLTPAKQRWAQILGRAILLAYRFSGGVPAVLRSARLRIEPSDIRLEVTKAARAPDSEVVSDRLKLLASAIGVKRSEVVEIDAPLLRAG